MPSVTCNVTSHVMTMRSVMPHSRPCPPTGWGEVNEHSRVLHGGQRQLADVVPHGSVNANSRSQTVCVKFLLRAGSLPECACVAAGAISLLVAGWCVVALTRWLGLGLGSLRLRRGGFANDAFRRNRDCRCVLVILRCGSSCARAPRKKRRLATMRAVTTPDNVRQCLWVWRRSRVFFPASRRRQFVHRSMTVQRFERPKAGEPDGMIDH